MVYIGKNIIRLKGIDSTNTYALRLLEKNKPEEGTAIVADYQEKGKGQRETVWESEPGKNLLASFIFYPKIKVSDHFLLSQWFSLAVHETVLNEIEGNVKIKWPNDILVNEKKIAGILIENSIRGNIFLYSVAGVGINVNQKYFKKYSPEATSLFTEQKNHFLVVDLLKKLCNSLNKWYTILNNNNYEFISTFYSNALYRLGEFCWYEIHRKKIKAAIRGVNKDGQLLLEKENGELLKLNFKEVKYLFSQ